MEDWQYKDYKELLHKELDRKYNEYSDKRIEQILNYLHLNNEFNIHQWYPAYISSIDWWDYSACEVDIEGEVNLMYDYERCKEFVFPAYWLTLDENKLVKEMFEYVRSIDKAQKDKKNKEQKQQNLKKIEDLQAEIDRLKGDTK